MSEDRELILIMSNFKPKYPFKVTDSKIIINARDLPTFLRDIRTFCTYDLDPGIWFAGKRVIVYNTQEEFVWQVILA